MILTTIPIVIGISKRIAGYSSLRSLRASIVPMTTRYEVNRPIAETDRMMLKAVCEPESRDRSLRDSIRTEAAVLGARKIRIALSATLVDIDVCNRSPGHERSLHAAADLSVVTYPGPSNFKHPRPRGLPKE